MKVADDFVFRVPEVISTRAKRHLEEMCRGPSLLHCRDVHAGALSASGLAPGREEIDEAVLVERSPFSPTQTAHLEGWNEQHSTITVTLPRTSLSNAADIANRVLSKLLFRPLNPSNPASYVVDVLGYDMRDDDPSCSTDPLNAMVELNVSVMCARVAAYGICFARVKDYPYEGVVRCAVLTEGGTLGSGAVVPDGTFSVLARCYDREPICNGTISLLTVEPSLIRCQCSRPRLAAGKWRVVPNSAPSTVASKDTKAENGDESPAGHSEAPKDVSEELLADVVADSTSRPSRRQTKHANKECFNLEFEPEEGSTEAKAVLKAQSKLERMEALRQPASKKKRGRQ